MTKIDSFAAIAFASCMIVFAALPAVSAAPEQPTIVRKQQVLPLTGHLNAIPVVNSNSPEVVKTEGILLSTNSPEGKTTPDAHLNKPLSGHFDIFLHHINNREPDKDGKTLFVGVLLTNEGKKTAYVKVLEAASYLSQPDSPFIKLDAVVDNQNGTVFAGPGDRVTNVFLRQQSQPLIKSNKSKRADIPGLTWPEKIKVKPGETVMLKALPVPVKGKVSQVNGRSGLIRLRTNQPICVATVGLFSDNDEPPLADFVKVLTQGALSSQRDKPPSSPDADGFGYGRVAGVALGNAWKTVLKKSVDSTSDLIDLPRSGGFLSFVISSVDRGTHGTGQVQSAPLLVRYPDTAYKAHGNYGIEYDLTLNLVNRSDVSKKAFLTFETPIKSKTGTGAELTFYDPPPSKVFYRGTIKFTYPDEHKRKTEKFVHIVQNQGQQGEKLVSLDFKPGEHKKVNVRLLYPPDSTPPQVFTIGTE